MSDINILKANVMLICADYQWSFNDLAKKMGITRQALSDIFNSRSHQQGTITRIANALRVEESLLFLPVSFEDFGKLFVPRYS